MQCEECRRPAALFCASCEAGAPGLYLCSPCSDNLHTRPCRKDHETYSLCGQCGGAAGTVICSSCSKLGPLCFCEACSAVLHREGGPRAGHKMDAARFVPDLADELLLALEAPEPEPARKKKKTSGKVMATVSPDLEALAGRLELAGSLRDFEQVHTVLERCREEPADGKDGVVDLEHPRPQQWVKDLAVVVAAVWPSLAPAFAATIKSCSWTFPGNGAAAALFQQTHNQWLEGMDMAAKDRAGEGEKCTALLREIVGGMQQCARV